MGDDLALPRVILPIAGVEEASVDGHERVETWFGARIMKVPVTTVLTLLVVLLWTFV